MIRPALLLAFLSWLATSGTASAQVVIETTAEPGLQACFRQHMLNVPGTVREWVAQLSLRPDGTVAAVDSVDPPLGESRLDRCLLDALHAMQLPAGTGGSAGRIEFPIHYRVRGRDELQTDTAAPFMDRMVAVLATHEADTDACFESSGTAQEHLRLIAHISVQADGAVSEVTFTDSNAGEAIRSCLSEVLRAISFPPPDEPLIFDYPMSFTRWGSALPNSGR